MNYFERCEKLLVWMYPFVMCSSFLCAFILQRQSTIPTAILLLYVSIYGFLSFKKCYKTSFVWQFCILMSYMLLSGYNYLFQDLPFLAYYTDIRGVIIPMLFFFVGFINNDLRIYKYFLYSTLFCISVGIILYIIQPSWYLSYKANLFNDAWYFRASGTIMSDSDIMDNAFTIRFTSFMTAPYDIAYYGTFSLCLLLYDMLKEQECRIIRNPYISAFMLGIFLTGVLLAMTRAAIFFSFCMVIFYFVYRSLSHNKNGKILKYGLVVIFFAGIFAVNSSSNNPIGRFLVDTISERIDDMNVGKKGLDDSRKFQNQSVLNSWNDVVFGDGMGSKGSVMREYGKIGITDGNWTRFTIEYGVVGLFIFLITMGKTLIRAWRLKTFYLAEFFIVLYGLASMSFADTLSKGHMILIFWFAIGRIWNTRYLDNLIKYNIKI